MTKKEDDKKTQRVIEIKARMFDLMAHRSAVNKEVEQELHALNNEMKTLLPDESK
ncbi:MAG: hypothetical protein K0U78_21555 [Actinomycetia bacterium]|nr:hypothetical protein [Actinomycetes bacterium]